VDRKLSRKHIAVALAPVAAGVGLVGVGLGASPAYADSASTTFSFLSTPDPVNEPDVHVTHDCSVEYELNYAFNGPNTLQAELQSFGDDECSSGFAEVDVSYEQADGDHVRVFNSAIGLGAFAQGFWDNVRNVDHIANDQINASYTENYDSRCDVDATMAAFGHDCSATFSLSHGK
jgi:hypothetical protein